MTKFIFGGRLIGTAWTICKKCRRYTSHDHYATNDGEVSVCEECGETKKLGGGK